MSKLILCAIIAVLLAPIQDDKITVHIPRELFFISSSEELFLNFFETYGGVISELSEDSATFWRNQAENAGTVYIEISFSYADLSTIREILEDEIFLYLLSVEYYIDAISGLDVEVDETATRYIFIADIEEFLRTRDYIFLLDFTFPSMGQLEYLLRIFSLYNMAYLKEIVFYLEDADTQERFRIYDFLLDAPLGLSMRHLN